MKTVQKVFLSLMLLLGARVSFGMEKEEVEVKILQIQCMMYEDPERAAVESAALALRKPVSEVRKRAQLDVSKIKQLFHMKQSSYTAYSACLDDGDEVVATYFVEGPMAGKYDCNCISPEGIFMPMDSGVYGRLRDLYESQNK